MVLAGAHSDATGERIWHIALPLLVGAAALAWSATALSLLLTNAALSLAALGIYAAIGTFWSVPTAILTGTGAAAGLALVNAIGNLGGLAGPAVIGVLKQANGDFTLALLFLAGALAAGACITLLFGRVAWAGDTSSRVIQ
jgi:ACS family tartrate transporter-like MFS transporter